MGAGRDGPAVSGRLYAVAGCDGVAELPDALDGDGGGQLPSLAGLAAHGGHLARQFTDYEPGIHWSQVQMQSGTTGINTPRIYNPIKQGHDQDPTGTFTRRWLPELAVVPDALLQEPWKWEGAAKLAYPAPVIDVPAAARHARDRIWAIRRDAGHAPAAARVIERHASRQDNARRFVNDRSPRKRGGDSRQMSLDL